MGRINNRSAVSTADEHLRGALEHFVAGDLDAAADLISAALLHLEQGGCRNRLGAAYKLHAMVFISQDRTSQALAAATKALGYPDLSASDRMYVYATIAMCFHRLVDLPTGARVLLERAWPEAQRSADPKAIVDCASRCAGLMHDYACWASGIPNLNLVGSDKPTLEPAAIYLERAQNFIQACLPHTPALSPQDRSWLSAQQAIVSGLAEGWAAAKPHIEAAISMAEGLPRPTVLATTAAGTAARIAGELPTALQYLLRTRSLNTVRNPHVDRYVAWELSHVFLALGRAADAVAELRTFEHLQTRKARLDIEWNFDGENITRYGEQSKLTEARNLVFGGPMPAPIRRTIGFIESHLDSRLSLEEIAEHAGLNKRTLQEMFRKHQAIGIAEFARERRMQHADALLRKGCYSVAAVAQMSGYTNAANFSRDYRRRFGRPPSMVKA